MTNTAERDSQRAAVYNAEHLFATMLSREAGSTIQLAGATITMPATAKFGDIAAAQRYVDTVLTRPSLIATFGPLPAVTVRARRGQCAAHYEVGHNTIAIPTVGQGRSMLNERVVAHELAHHIEQHTTPAGTVTAAHGRQFTSIQLTLIEDVIGPEAAFILRVLYHDNGVQIG
jgi:putative metallohydrolase (TIGR04338 family)